MNAAMIFVERDLIFRLEFERADQHKPGEDETALRQEKRGVFRQIRNEGYYHAGEQLSSRPKWLGQTSVDALSTFCGCSPPHRPASILSTDMTL